MTRVKQCTLVLPIWYVVGSRPIFLSSSTEMSSLDAVVFFGNKDLNCSKNSCRIKTEKIREDLFGRDVWSKPLLTFLTYGQNTKY